MFTFLRNVAAVLTALFCFYVAALGAGSDNAGAVALAGFSLLVANWLANQQELR
jgi:hypothetical protein